METWLKNFHLLSWTSIVLDHLDQATRLFWSSEIGVHDLPSLIHYRVKPVSFWSYAFIPQEIGSGRICKDQDVGKIIPYAILGTGQFDIRSFGFLQFHIWIQGFSIYDKQTPISKKKTTMEWSCRLFGTVFARLSQNVIKASRHSALLNTA